VGAACSAFGWANCQGEIVDYDEYMLYGGAFLFLDTQLSTLLQLSQRYLRMNHTTYTIKSFTVNVLLLPVKFSMLYMTSLSLRHSGAKRIAYQVSVQHLTFSHDAWPIDFILFWPQKISSLFQLLPQISTCLFNPRSSSLSQFIQYLFFSKEYWEAAPTR
jgi:hypothetical protein